VSLFQTGVVHPQLATTLSNANGALPVLVNSKIWVTGFPWGILPKSNSDSFKLNSPSVTLGVILFVVDVLFFLLTLVTFD
jgi:hypothetical protein